MPKTKKLQPLLVLSLFISLLSPIPTNAASSHAGKIYLQVEQNGEAWYVNPVDGNRYYLGRPADAFNLMRTLGLGISEKNINEIPIGLLTTSDIDTDQDGLSNDLESAIGTSIWSGDSDNDEFADKTEIEKWFNPLGKGILKKNNALANKLSGRIILQSEKHGEAWYVNPKDKKRYFLGRPQNAFEIMYNLGIGITNSGLAKIPTKYVSVGLKVNDLYELKYPDGWEKSWPTIDGYYNKIPITNILKIKPTVDAGYLEVLALESSKDYTLGAFQVADTPKTEILLSDNLMIGVKPALKQIVKYNSKTKLDSQEINKGAEFFLDIMLSTTEFIHLHMIIYEEKDVELYQKYFNQIVKDFKLL